MPESGVDIDRLGTLTFEHFERDSTPSTEAWCSGSDIASDVSSPPYSSDDFESPINSPNQGSPPSFSDSWSCQSEEEIPENVSTSSSKPGSRRPRHRREIVSKRNERERRRVRLISEGFGTLRKKVIQPSNRKLPKLEILRRAIHYIKALQDMLKESDVQMRVNAGQEHILYPQQGMQVSYLYDYRPPLIRANYSPTLQESYVQSSYQNMWHGPTDTPSFHHFSQ